MSQEGLDDSVQKRPSIVSKLWTGFTGYFSPKKPQAQSNINNNADESKSNRKKRQRQEDVQLESSEDDILLQGPPKKRNQNNLSVDDETLHKLPPKRAKSTGKKTSLAKKSTKSPSNAQNKQSAKRVSTTKDQSKSISENKSRPSKRTQSSKKPIREVESSSSSQNVETDSSSESETEESKEESRSEEGDSDDASQNSNSDIESNSSLEEASEVEEDEKSEEEEEEEEEDEKQPKLDIKFPPAKIKEDKNATYYAWVYLEGVKFTRGENVYLRSGTPINYIGKIIELRLNKSDNKPYCMVRWWLRNTDFPHAKLEENELVEINDSDIVTLESLITTIKPKIDFLPITSKAPPVLPHQYFYRRYMNKDTGEHRTLL